MQIYERANDVSRRPPLPELRMIPVPLFLPVAIVSVGVKRITDTIMAIKGRISAAPADLHETVGQQRHLVVKAVFEDSCVRSHRYEVRLRLNI